MNAEKKDAFYTSKQNSDANGMKYQWGRKDPFTFATSSESGGKSPVKIYTIDGVLIYQKENGGDNKDKQPVGGVIVLTTNATSMMETIKNPITFYGWSVVINQTGHTKSLWDYYWTSYSRGIDGYSSGNTMYKDWHNNYLTGYTSQRFKSIYDPCPYSYRVQSNGTWEQFKAQSGWIWGSYLGGVNWILDNNTSWLTNLGCRTVTPFYDIALWAYYSTSTSANTSSAYSILVQNGTMFLPNRHYATFWGRSVRCIEFSDLFQTLLNICFRRFTL